MSTPEPSHLQTRDPAKADVHDIREEADREIDAYAGDVADLVLLTPEDAWEQFLALTGAQEPEGEARYRGVRFRKGAVTTVVAQEGF